MPDYGDNEIESRLHGTFLILRGGKCVCQACNATLGGREDITAHRKSGKHKRNLRSYVPQELLDFPDPLQPLPGPDSVPVVSDGSGPRVTRPDGEALDGEGRGGGSTSADGALPSLLDMAPDLRQQLGSEEGMGSGADLGGPADCALGMDRSDQPMPGVTYDYLPCRPGQAGGLLVPVVRAAPAPVDLPSGGRPPTRLLAELARRTRLPLVGDVGETTDQYKQTSDADISRDFAAADQGDITDPEQLVRIVACLARIHHVSSCPLFYR